MVNMTYENTHTNEAILSWVFSPVFPTEAKNIIMGYLVNIFVEYPPEDLICPICCEVFRDPEHCKDGHTFCSECIREWLRTSHRCPIDKEVIRDSILAPNRVICGIINNLEVYCQERYDDDDGTHKEKCPWTGKLQLLSQHRETCLFQQVQCPNTSCNTKMQRRELEEHDKICKYKKVECQKCGTDLIRHEVQLHKDLDCPEEMVRCPNDCTCFDGSIQKLKRSEIEDHLARKCGNIRMQCPFKDQGCNAEIFRKDFQNHLQEYVSKHMYLVSMQNTNLAKENQILSNRCAELSARLKNSLDDLSTFVWTISDYPALFKKYSGSYFRSPTFWLCCHSWFLELYPNGDQDAEGFVSLHLCLNEATGLFVRGQVIPSIKTTVCCRFSVISHNPDNKDVTWAGNLTFSKETTTAGRPKLIKATTALSTDFCTSTDGILVVKCSIQLA